MFLKIFLSVLADVTAKMATLGLNELRLKRQNHYLYLRLEGEHFLDSSQFMVASQQIKLHWSQ
jgi:hypothetical protein